MTRLTSALSRLIPGVSAYFGGDKIRPLVVTLVAGDPDRPGGIYLRGVGQPESKSRIIRWSAALQWAVRVDGIRAQKYYAVPREDNPDYARVYNDLVRVLTVAFPDDWQPRLAVLNLKPPHDPNVVPDEDGPVATPGTPPVPETPGDDITLDEALAASEAAATWKPECGMVGCTLDVPHNHEVST